MFSKQAIALALSIAAAAEAAHQGFNYGSTKPDGSYNYEADFKTEFQTAKNLVGTSGFTSARLYTMIQGGTTNDPIQAIPAAIASETSLLLGLWTSGGNVDNEIAALKSAINTYGESFTKLVVGISVGSEDLYRNSVTGAKNKAGVGINPDTLVNYIKQVKSAISGTTLSGASIGHVDTWDAWTNGTNAAVIDEIDWLGFDGYPYYQTTMANGIDQGKSLFNDAVAKTKAVANGKEVWITETGWPVSGPNEGDAVASLANAKQYWDEVGCPLFGETNTWWYMLADAGSSPSFGVTGSTSSTNPLFNLSCNTSTSTSSSSASSSTKSGSASSSSVSGFATSSKAGFGVGHNTHSATQTSTPLIVATQTASSSSGTSASNSGSSSSGSSSSGSSSSGSSSSGSNSGSGSSSSASATSTTSFNSATRSTGSAFGALAAALVLAIAI